MSLRLLPRSDAAKTLSRRGTAATALATLFAAMLVGADPASAIPTISSNITNDPNADRGTLSFYDSSGNVITSGTDLHHIFSYAVGSTAARAGATKATVYFAFPDHTQADSQNWTSDVVTASTTFPNQSAPPPVNGFTNPVATASPSDADLAALLPTTTQDQTAGYQGFLQIRLYDSGPGVPFTPDFWATDIYYDASTGTWQQAFPAVAQTTYTALATSPANGTTPNSAITLTATLSPNTAAGSVQFKDGSTNIGSPIAVSNGTAQITTSYPSSGSHSFTAAFAPTNSNAYAPSTSTAVTYVVGDATSLSIGKSVTISYGKSTSVSGTLTDTTANQPLANQSVSIYHRASSTARWVKSGSASTDSTGNVSFPEKPTARTLYQLRFAGTGTLLPASSGTETVSVNQLVSINLKPGTVAHGKPFAVWGGVTPSATGRKITLQRKVGTSFRTVTTALTKRQKLPNGKTGIGYVFHTSQTTRGNYVYRVTVGATKTLGGAKSKSVTEHVT